jgi:hypothetical protein
MYPPIITLKNANTNHMITVGGNYYYYTTTLVITRNECE